MACGMEILTSILASAVAEIGRCFCVCICPKIKSTVRFNRTLRDLQKEENKLADLKKEVEKRLESAEKNERSPTTEVKNWLTKVDEFVDKVKSVREAATENDKSPYGCHCHCSQRVRLGSKVGRLLKEVETLLKAGNFPDGTVSVVDDSAKPVEYIPGPSTEYQTTASRNLQDLMKTLEDDKVQRIGVWGMGGVGKTTLVKSLNNKLSSASPDQPFSIVIYITVSKEVDSERVQREIADRLNLEIKAGKSIEGMASRLDRRLKKEKFLLILDDVWDDIDLGTLGIPEPTIQNGSKILLTSRFADVCHRMKVQVEVKVNTLGDEEAWQLFSQQAGKMANNFQKTAKDVAKECGGLPLALITVGTAMRKKETQRLWENALDELKGSAPSISGVQKKVYNSLKLSYDSLEDKKLKSCFLYCALYPEDFSIEVSELLQCWLAEGLIDDERGFEKFVNKGVSLIETLKDACLLEDGSRVGTVKMHDVVRDVAIWIASSTDENDSRSLVRSGKVFNVSRSGMLLPPPLQLGELRAFIVQSRPLFYELSPLRALVSLQVLNLHGSDIATLREEMGNLINLRQVKLSRTFSLKFIQAGVVSKWTRLQFLDMTDSNYLWSTKQQAPKGEATLEELLSLKSLSCLSIVLDDYSCSYPEYLLTQISRIRIFHFVVNPAPRYGFTSGEHDKRKLTVNWRENKSRDPETMGWLLINATSMVWNGTDFQDLNFIIGGLLSVRSVGRSNLVELRSLTINNGYMYGSISARGSDVTDLLPNLEELSLDSITSLESISELVDRLGLKLSKLKTLLVFRCAKMKYLFSRETELPNLELMTVSICSELEKLFDYNVVLPNLRILKLNSLTMLSDLCVPGESWPRLEKVYVFQCSLLRSLPLNIGNANSIQEIRGESQYWWSELNWDNEETKSRLQQCYNNTAQGRSGQYREGFEREDDNSFLRMCYASGSYGMKTLI